MKARGWLLAAVAALAEEAALRGDRRRRSSWPVPRQRPPERRPAPQTRPHAQAPSCTATTPVFSQPVSTARCRSSPPPPAPVDAHARVPRPQHSQLSERNPQRRPCLGSCSPAREGLACRPKPFPPVLHPKATFLTETFLLHEPLPLVGGHSMPCTRARHRSYKRLTMACLMVLRIFSLLSHTTRPRAVLHICSRARVAPPASMASFCAPARQRARVSGPDAGPNR